MAGLRQSAADRIYQEPAFEPIIPLLRQYRIEYIYVGELEKTELSRPILEQIQCLLRTGFFPVWS